MIQVEDRPILSLQRRIVLEDHTGEKHALHLLEIIDDQFFILLPPTQAEALANLQATHPEVADDAVDILTDHLTGVCVRDHSFLDTPDLAELLGESRHHILRLCGLRLGGQLAPADGGDLSVQAFVEERKRRHTW